MQIYEVTDQRFRKYGRVLDTPSLTGEVRKELAEQMEKTPLPADVVYEPSVESLEQTKAAEILKEEIFGELRYRSATVMETTICSMRWNITDPRK